MSNEEITPLMKQYGELKSQVADALLFFRMGDFYELFGDDAVVASELLEITLTSRDRNKTNPMPMAGVPHHSAQQHIQKLLKLGKKVAIGEQVEDPETVKGTGKIVRREIVRILTPGIHFDVEGFDAQYLATALQIHSENFLLACLDISTGEVLLSQPLSFDDLRNEVRKLPIRHFLNFGSPLEFNGISLAGEFTAPTLVETLPKSYLSQTQAEALLKNQYELEHLDTFIPTLEGQLALGILVAYILKTQQKKKLGHLRLPQPLHKPQSLSLGPNTFDHLDLQDLFTLVNHDLSRTRSTLGSRQLKRWMMNGLTLPEEILKRQQAVQELTSLKQTASHETITQLLSQLYDLERICGRITTGLANPKDTFALGRSLSILKPLERFLEKAQSETLRFTFLKLQILSEKLSPLSKFILDIQKEDAPHLARDGGIFKRGTSPELDRLLSLTEDGQKWLIDLETRERELTGIPSLKVRYNRVFGYYIEITHTHSKNVPSHYQRKQTMVGAERFFTEELKKFEEEILTASIKLKNLELETFENLISSIQLLIPEIMQTAQLLGEFDTLLCFAELSKNPGWVFPEIDSSFDLEIIHGYHPVVAHRSQGKGPGRFIPNHLALSPSTRLTLVITGPNMGGKSTLMRQIALLVLLGQIGAPVPAKKARWGYFSSIFTRIGAQDAIAKGQSTFMVEMSELAHILHHADERSLIILDEIGRGTSTYDGMSVAWASLNWICQKIQARTLFATHYHELIQLSQDLPRLAHGHMAVDGTKDLNYGSLRFLYELREGPTSESFGIQVAQLAGLPKAVIQEAWKTLENLEKNDKKELNAPQLSLFSETSLQRNQQKGNKKAQPALSSSPLPPPPPAPPHPVLEELQTLDINSMTPVQALNFVVKLRTLCAEEKKSSLL